MVMMCQVRQGKEVKVVQTCNEKVDGDDVPSDTRKGG